MSVYTMKGYVLLGGAEWSALFCGRYTPDDGAAAVHYTYSESNHISDVQHTATALIMFHKCFYLVGIMLALPSSDKTSQEHFLLVYPTVI